MSEFKQVAGAGPRVISKSQAKRLAVQKPATCQWFLRCSQPATGTSPHPILGAVPTCARCAHFAAHGEFPKGGQQ
jgi:hypothetical protein